MKRFKTLKWKSWGYEASNVDYAKLCKFSDEETHIPGNYYIEIGETFSDEKNYDSAGAITTKRQCDNLIQWLKEARKWLK